MFNNLKILISFVLVGLLIGCTDWNIDPEDIETPDPVTVTITAVTDSSVTINWTESLDSKFLSYTVYYDKTSPVDTIAANAVDTIFLKQDTHKTITGLQANKQYFFRVSVNSTLGSASFSAEVDTTTFESIADKKLALSVNKDKTKENSISLSWTKNWEDQYDGNDYLVYYGFTPNVDSSSLNCDTTSLDTIVIDSLESDTAYFFKVYQIRNGVPSAGSNVVSDTTTKGEPSAVKLISKDAGNNHIKLSWSTSIDTSDFKRYFVVLNTVTAVDTFSRYDSNSVNLFPINLIDSTTIEIDSIDTNALSMSTLYWYSIYVEDSAGNVTPTAPDSITTDDGIADPVELSIDSVTNTSAVLIWTKNIDADFSQYLIYYGTTDSVTEDDSLKATIVNKETTSYKITGLDSLTKFWFKVFVKSTYGIATPSNEVVNYPVILYSNLDTIINEADSTDTSYTVNLIWQGGDDYNSDSFKKYVVCRSESSFNSVLSGDKKAEITDIESYDYLDTTVIKNKTYHYRIYHQSLDSEGYLVNQFSNEVVVEVQ